MKLELELKERFIEGEKRGEKIGEKRGRKEGIKIGKLQTLFEMYDDKDISLEKAVEKSGLSEKNFSIKFEEWKANR